MKTFLRSCRRICLATALAVAACFALTAMFLMLPPAVSFGAALVGIVMFMCGGELRWKWMAAAGGVLTYAAMFAWALRQ